MRTIQTTLIVGAATCLGIALAQPAPAGAAETGKEIIVAQTAPEQPWWGELGPVYRGNMQIGFTGSSYSQMRQAGILANPSGVGAATGFGDRTYSDGFVRRDPGTGNPQGLDPNGTWNWGYDNASQHNSSANTLSFHGAGNAAYTPDFIGNVSQESRAEAVGLDFSGGRTLLKTDTIQVDLAAGFQTGWGLENHFQTSTFRESLKQVQVTDSYNVAGIALPAPGYQGTYTGPLGTQGTAAFPVIPNQPASREINVVGLGWTEANAIKLNVSSDLYELWLGPRISVQATPWLALYVNPRVGVTFVNVDAQRTEQLIAAGPGGAKSTVATWKNNVTANECLFAGGVTGGAKVRLTPRVFLDVFAGYEWVSNSINVQVGPNQLSLNPSGYTLGAAIGVKF